MKTVKILSEKSKEKLELVVNELLKDGFEMVGKIEVTHSNRFDFVPGFGMGPSSHQICGQETHYTLVMLKQPRYPL